VEKILSTHYKNAPDGIPGNDDTGTMSAWAVFSMLGFYPDCPADPYYTLTRPTFDKATVALPGGASLVISRSARPSRALFNGRSKGYRIAHQDLVKGGSITWR
jgi:putative alpha-1,2-mannosidase